MFQRFNKFLGALISRNTEKSNFIHIGRNKNKISQDKFLKKPNNNRLSTSRTFKEISGIKL